MGGQRDNEKGNTLRATGEPAPQESGHGGELVASLRLDLDVARQQQAATADILRILSRSRSDPTAVLPVIAEHAARLCEAFDAVILLRDGQMLREFAHHGPIPSLGDRLFPVARGTVMGRTVIDGKVVHIEDLQNDTDLPEGRALALELGHRTILAAPLLHEGKSLGALIIRRLEVRPFSDGQIALLQTFADQAAIAIENAHTFEELQARNRDLQEALQHQTATSRVLEVISRSAFDLQKVLDTLIESAVVLCGADIGAVRRREGDVYKVAATFGYGPEARARIEAHSAKPSRTSVFGQAVLDDRTVHIPDLLADPDFARPDVQQLTGGRGALGVLLRREGTVIGTLVLQRLAPGPFTPRQIDLVETFASQAVIAIENTRLIGELQARTQELTESLEYQTAIGDVLNVISRSPNDLQPVLDTIVTTAARLCDAEYGLIFKIEDGKYRVVATSNAGSDFVSYMQGHEFKIDRATLTGRVFLERRTVQIADALTDPDYAFAGQATGRYRSMLGVPLMRDGEILGNIALLRTVVSPFTDRQVELVTTFADQAVIAINNVALFEAVQARTAELSESLRQQTATADVLKVISRSAFDLKSVLQTLVESAAHLCDAEKVTITRQRDGVFYREEAYGFSAEFLDRVRGIPIVPERGSASGRALLEGRTIHIDDVLADPDYTFEDAIRLGGFRTILAVPMLREHVAIGVLVLTREEVRPFSDKQIEMVSTFADQAAIAIENVRLFENVEARTRELARSLEELRTAQDRLVQTEKLASLGQLTAGIAHEIKNPLNFVNNFAALSVDLLDELQEILGKAGLDTAAREEVAELSDMLRGNLDKVVQHGRRADSIVKNMLLHSREGSGERRSVDINAVIEESLNLAYHGARAEKPGFNITLEKSLDPAAGNASLFQQEIVRVLLNLISNGFYAAQRRKAAAGSDFEPRLAVSTRDLGDRVEIRVRDNGTGIPPEVRDKIFNPFFTTKPAGEGTGLGLSLSHDIVVKQHGGAIEVDTAPGSFTEFRIILPRGTAPTAGAVPTSPGRGR